MPSCSTNLLIMIEEPSRCLDPKVELNDDFDMFSLVKRRVWRRWQCDMPDSCMQVHLPRGSVPFSVAFAFGLCISTHVVYPIDGLNVLSRRGSSPSTLFPVLTIDFLVDCYMLS